jgi:(2Fe-2S) ferredoxin
VFVCSNGNCINRSHAVQVYDWLTAWIERYDQENPASNLDLRCKLTGCLDYCQDGPVLRVLPEGVWYPLVDEGRLQRIFSEHLLGGQVVDDLAVWVSPKGVGSKW